MSWKHQVRDAVFTTLDIADKLTGRGHPLTPPRRLMNGGTNSIFRNDFNAIGRTLFSYLVKAGGVKPTDRVLDIGCSVGRMAIQFSDYLTTGTYDGFDIERPAVEFCQRVITPRHPNFHFVHADLHNAHYTPDSKIRPHEYRFPYENASFDFAFLTSVFTHMQRPETEQYIAEIARVLAPGGRVFATFFLLDEQSEAALTEGKAAFTFAYSGVGTRVQKVEDPDHAVAHDRRSVLETFASHGLQVRDCLPGAWRGNDGGTGFQDTIVAVK